MPCFQSREAPIASARRHCGLCRQRFTRWPSLLGLRKINNGACDLMASTWRGVLGFGLLTIPIRLYPAARSQRTYLHQLHDKCHTRLKQPLFCPTCNRIVSRDEVVKGYETRGALCSGGQRRYEENYAEIRKDHGDSCVRQTGTNRSHLL